VLQELPGILEVVKLEGPDTVRQLGGELRTGRLPLASEVAELISQAGYPENEVTGDFDNPLAHGLATAFASVVVPTPAVSEIDLDGSYRRAVDLAQWSGWSIPGFRDSDHQFQVAHLDGVLEAAGSNRTVAHRPIAFVGVREVADNDLRAPTPLQEQARSVASQLGDLAGVVPGATVRVCHAIGTLRPPGVAQPGGAASEFGVALVEEVSDHRPFGFPEATRRRLEGVAQELRHQGLGSGVVTTAEAVRLWAFVPSSQMDAAGRLLSQAHGVAVDALGPMGDDQRASAQRIDNFDPGPIPEPWRVSLTMTPDVPADAHGQDSRPGVITVHQRISRQECLDPQAAGDLLGLIGAHETMHTELKRTVFRALAGDRPGEDDIELRVEIPLALGEQALTVARVVLDRGRLLLAKVPSELSVEAERFLGLS